jgi:hypothetical protein
MYVCFEYYTSFYIIHKFEVYVCTFCIIFCMILSTWLHTKFLFEGLDMYLCSTIFKVQTPSFKFSQIVLAPLQNLFSYLFDVNSCYQQLCKIKESWSSRIMTNICATLSGIDDVVPCLNTPTNATRCNPLRVLRSYWQRN